MPWSTCLSSQDVLIQCHHVNLGDRAVQRQRETCSLQDTRCSGALSCVLSNTHTHTYIYIYIYLHVYVEAGLRRLSFDGEAETI